MQIVELVSVETVKDFAADLVKNARETLLEKGWLPRLCWVFTTADKVPDSNGFLEMHHLPNPQNTKAPENVKDPNATAITILDLNPNDSGLVGMLTALDPKFGEVLPEFLTMGKMMGVDPERIPRHLVNAWCTATNNRPQDITSIYMKHMIKKMEAYAYIHQSESYFKEYNNEKDAKHHGDLSQDLTSREGFVVSLETHSYAQITTVLFTRTERDKGKVVSFDEPKTMSTDEKGATIGGRLHGILREMPRN